MSNGPPGDVEILMPAGEDEHTADKEAIRLRLHRGKHTLEVSRHLTKAGGRKDVGEWTKKVIAYATVFERRVFKLVRTWDRV